MKIKLLTTIIAGVLLAGCGGGNDNSVDGGGDKDKKTTPVLAFDGAINGMVASYTCADGTSGTTTTKTDGYGFVTVISDTFADKPESCSVVLTVVTPNDYDPDTDLPLAVDMSNGKNMSNVVYTVPKGLLEKGQKIAATPFTTLVDKAIKQSGEANSANVAIDAIIEEVFKDLGINTSIVDPKKLMSDPAATLKALDSTVAQDIVAKAMVLSDVLITHKDNTDISPADIAAVTTTVANDLVKKNPYFPAADEGSSDQIYVDLSDELADKGNFDTAASGTVPPVVETANKNPIVVPDADIPDPENPPVDPTPEPTPPPTGGTGGSGDGGGNGN
ncbi:hypothetical protein GLP30_07640 [Photobacterium phosphoreum]|uniref:Serine/threonine protein kinase n=1 Tax=Photobacterium phosphoreum TaxID=659 RepID=A0AAW4ZR11_PHOPO|nr:hypothetical protein [Photobacterium phosphoreum]MCD9490707.1 hypothetical protein [Photobacterium phosphoreum]MCF2189973.1 hypothetical protein [Photobacterium phosphoreum]MCF2300818.1 hypothetical protein [Photobacterium phosphoreum]